MRLSYKPMLAQNADAPFNSLDWIFEIKWDGIRAISYVNSELSIRSRNGKELKYNFPELEELKTLAKSVVLDGEIVVMKNGKADFQTVLERSRTGSSMDIEYEARKSPATYVIFDILERDGKTLTNRPLIERKKVLKECVAEGKQVLLSVFIEKEGQAYYEAAVAKGVEGIMAKKKDSLYEPGARSSNWLKIKKLLSCDCVIFGYTEGEGDRQQTFGALILGLYDNNNPVYVGKVGTGFSESCIAFLEKIFRPLRAKGRTLQGVDVPEKITWLEPELVCEVVYQTVTRDSRLRMPRFRSIRPDKAPFECTLDQLRQDRLVEYLSKRDFNVTPEPLGEKREEGKAFVVQEHHARKLHYDLRLQREGVLKSWAVPKGIPEKPGEKRLAVETEDHPLEYGKFEGTIPVGQYGAGTVKIWDSGSYEPIVWEQDKIEFSLNGKRLNGRYVLVKLKRAGEKQWLLLKGKGLK